MKKKMRTFRHWTPAYIVNRITEKVYRKNHPGDPWLTPAAVQFLKGYLKASDQGLEFGSGGSTIWFAKRIDSLTSIEQKVPIWQHPQIIAIGSRVFPNLFPFV